MMRCWFGAADINKGRAVPKLDWDDLAADRKDNPEVDYDVGSNVLE